jgi:hypothetical protein
MPNRIQHDETLQERSLLRDKQSPDKSDSYWQFPSVSAGGKQPVGRGDD